MKLPKILGLILIVLLFLVACGGEKADIPTAEIEGPALVMFYTDN